MENFIVIGIVFVIVFAAVMYIIKAKKSGRKCIGCPDGCSCSGNGEVHNCSCSSSCIQDGNCHCHS